MEDLVEKVAVITGGAGALGLGLARAFASEQMRVVLADIDEVALERAVAGLEASGADVLGVPTDIADARAIIRLREAAFERFETVHVLCNNAMGGGNQGGSLCDPIDVSRWQAVMNVGLYPVLHGLNAFLPRMLEQGSGHVVNTASRAGLLPHWSLGAYPAAKAAMITVSEMLHQDLAERGAPIGVTVLTPGPIRTPGLVATVADLSGSDSALREHMATRLALAVEPDDVASLVVRAIKTDTLYVNSHEDTFGGMRERVECMVAAAGAIGILR